MVGLYYGFLTTLSIGPSYIFLLRARVMEEGEEGTEKRKLKGISKTEEVGESEEERNIEIETLSEGGEANQKQGTKKILLLFFTEEEVDPSKIDETEKLRVTGKNKNKGRTPLSF
ncbi:hypothetical protein Godav_013640 [Gossypium davidsonii]|uniref:Translocon at the inner envelope membrane of chloroplasts 214 n=1 Tax=Gossypium davidsonii TaxID=34287 RepID=A0A7J8RH11_GOSDV|nr:hypothetical protein [Gossypium davidsonii]